MLYINRTMERTRRIVNAPKRLIAEDEVPAKPKKSNAKSTKRILDLDLSTLPPSQDRKFSENWGTAENPFWAKHFYNPDDNTTKLYQEATETLGSLLPANFHLYPDVEGAFGLANLELKPEFIRQMKRIPLFSKLQNGDYEIASSNSDGNISATIKFFRNNLPSFEKFKNQDDISWVIQYHRQLTAEILQFYGNKEKPRVATIRSRFNAITRIFRIAYETKNYELYDKYSSVVIFLGQHFEDNEHNNELDDIEIKKFVSFDVVLELQKELQRRFDEIPNKSSTRAYDLNQDLLLISLYSLIPPLRNEVKSLKFTRTVKRNEDWIYLRGDAVILDLNEDKKRHGSIYFNLTNQAPELARLLQQSYELYPRLYVFTYYKKYPDVSQQATPQALDDRLLKLFAFTGKMVSVNSLRSSYVSYRNSEAIKNGRQLTVNDKNEIAKRMRTSRKYLDEAYLKIFPMTTQGTAEQRIVIPRETVEVLPAYERQLERNKRYYDNNKEQVLKKQKEYKANKPLYDKARIRQLHSLNTMPNYYDKMRQQTKDKYNFIFENGRWI